MCLSDDNSLIAKFHALDHNLWPGDGQTEGVERCVCAER